MQQWCYKIRLLQHKEQLTNILTKSLKVDSFQHLQNALDMLEEPKINCCKDHTV